MIFEQTCYVYIVLPGETQFVTAARFSLVENQMGIKKGELVYGRKYLQNPNAVEIDPIVLKLRDKKYETVQNNGYFASLRDAMPDYWGRMVIEKHVSVPRLNDFDYLLYGPDDRAGALGFGTHVTPPAPKRIFNQKIDLPILQAAAEAIMGDNLNALNRSMPIQQVQELLLIGTSMGGARPKAVVEENNALWIAKFSTPEDRWDQPLVEYALLNLAKKCGLSVADSKLATVAGKNVLLVRRFDRDKSSHNGYYRHRMISALTMLGLDDSVSAKENWSYLSLADELRRVSSSPKQDLKELYKRICFNALVSNLDDHPRNHAIFAKDIHWRITPAYDLTPTPLIAKENRLLAMTCGSYGRAATKKNILSQHARFLLSFDEAESILDGMVVIIQSEWRKTVSQAGATHKDQDAIQSAFVYEGFFYK